MFGLVSIVVPIYNVKNYLLACVESLRKQTYELIEIILVDDGSTDGSAQLCDELKETDKRIHVIHKKNGGVSSARNIGVRKATGTYIMFVDGDDWLEFNAVELLVKRLLETNSDICYCKLFYKNESELIEATRIQSTKCYSSNDIIIQHLCCNFIASPCLSLIYREKVCDINFSEDIHTLEDWEYNFQILRVLHKVSILETPYYHYRSVIGSASKSPLNGRKLSCFKIANIVCETIKKYKLPYADYFYNVPAFLIYHMLVIYARNGYIEDSKNKLKAFARLNLKATWYCKEVSLKHKLYVLLACINPVLFKILYLIKNK